MKKLLVLLSLCMATGGLHAQSSRMQVLESAQNYVIYTKSGVAYHYLVHSQQFYKMQKHDGKVTIAGDDFDVADIKEMRFVKLSRFSLDEDSTAFSANYNIDHGLLAFRRTLTIGQWNTLVVPFSLTGRQVQDAFGEGTLLAKPRGITTGDVATVEFETIAINTDEEVVSAGQHYLIKPTREPDVAVGALTSILYAGKRIAGPVYIIPNVSLDGNQKGPAIQRLQSTDNQLFFAVRGSYQNQKEPSTSTMLFYAVDDNGRFANYGNSIQLQAFRSWMQQVKNDKGLDIRFYICGVEEDITGTSSLNSILQDDNRPDCVFDLQGRRVSNSTSTLKTGLYIINGKKIIVK